MCVHFERVIVTNQLFVTDRKVAKMAKKKGKTFTPFGNKRSGAQIGIGGMKSPSNIGIGGPKYSKEADLVEGPRREGKTLSYGQEQPLLTLSVPCQV